MPRISSFLMGVVAGVMLCLVAMNYHVVRAQDGFHLIRKHPAKLSEAYVDVRGFGVSDWTSHSELAAALTAVNKQYLMTGAATSALESGLNQVTDWARPQ